ncbi:glycoside hydrolase family 31 protein [Gonapodya prolifera JEL478]|uniref:Glycoside hydrolase family 31 protein n=1 Tax=Gonapodya prolifera (strain JEL478) TaxID=1344416 RepID=A0A139AWA5_GONPJ|nr:glycoside hydrolase family 31 protein [Gonapodya prolifera JEL478]|eukprot:KXS20755.1 glycoside hydrolase family 31 protein [Gonapodya prolifera JEL478]
MRQVIPQGFSHVPPKSSSLSSLLFEAADGSRATVTAVDSSIFRVTFAPPGLDASDPRSVLSRTHTVVGKSAAAADESVAGKARSDLRTLLDSPDTVFRLEIDSGNKDSRVYSLATPAVTARAAISPDGLLTLTFAGSAKSPSSQSVSAPFLEDLPLRAYTYDKNGGVAHYVKRKSTVGYYGGERGAPLELTGRRFRLDALDSMGYDVDRTDPLYKFTPYYLAVDKTTGESHAVFYDSFSRGGIDFGCEVDAFWGDYTKYEADQGVLDYYVIYGPTLPALVDHMSLLLGAPILPPKFSLGYLASAMGYAEHADAHKMLWEFPDKMREWNVPCDGMHLSSGYTVDPETGARNVFTWNLQRFPDPKGLFTKLNANGVRVFPNIKPWLLAGHPAYEAIKEKKGFVWDPETDSPSLTRLWSAGAGTSATGSYFDFTSEAARAFWKSGVKDLLEMGAEGMWNDNNEYTIHDDTHLYSFSAAPGASLPAQQAGLAGRALQTLLMATASFEATREHHKAVGAASSTRPKRPFLITRSGAPGIWRYAAHSWSGDNRTSWKTLRGNISMGVNAGLGLLGNYGHDIGGFAGPQPTPELLVRWIQMGVWLARFCVHSWKEEGVTEVGMYPEMLPIIRDAITLRYTLIPYFYTLLHLTSRHGAPVTRPLFWDFGTDPLAYGPAADTQFFVGPSILVAGVIEDGARSRKVYLPKDSKTGEGAAWCNFWTGEWVKGGAEVEADVPLERHGAVFVRAGGIVPTCSKVGRWVGDGDHGDRVVLFYPPPAGSAAGSWSFTLIEDDGETEGAPTTEIKIQLRVEDGANKVFVGAEVLVAGHKLAYDTVAVKLPQGDKREVVVEKETGIKLALQQ